MESDYRHAHSVTAYGHRDYAAAEAARPPITLEDVSGPVEILLVVVYCVVLYCVRRRALPVTVLAHALSMILLVGTCGHHIEKHWLGMDGIRGLLEPHELGAGLGMSLVVVGGTLAVIALQLHRESMLHGHVPQPHKTIFAVSAGAIYLVLVTRLNCTLGGSAINPVGGSYLLRVLRCPPILASILITSGLSVWLYTVLLKAEAGYVPRPVVAKSLEETYATCQPPSQATHTPEAQQQWELQQENLRWEQQQQQQQHYFAEQQRHEAEAQRLYYEHQMQMQYEQQQQHHHHVAMVAQQQQQQALLLQQQQQASFEQQQYAAQQAASFSEAITLHTPQAHPPISTNVNLYHTASTAGHSTSPTRRRPSTSSCASRVPPSRSRDNSKCSGLTSPLPSSCSSSSSSSSTSSSSSSESDSESSYAHSMSERLNERTRHLRQRRHQRMVEMPEKYTTEQAVQAGLHDNNPQSHREPFGTPRRRRRPQGAPAKEADSARGWSSASVGGSARRRSQERERPQWKFDSDNEQDMGRRMPMRQQQVAFSYAAEGTRAAAATGSVGSWVECFDEAGRAYWYNQLTQETSWTAPSARQS